jgi:hypothetical protein
VNGVVPVEPVRVPIRIREYISLENVIVIVPFSGKFTHFSGKFTRFVWDKNTSQYPINAFPPTLYSGSDASLSQLVPGCPTPWVGQITALLSAFTAIYASIFATF